MKVGDLVKHKRQASYGVGVVLEMKHRHLTFDRAVVLFSEFMIRCQFRTKDLEVINESR